MKLILINNNSTSSVTTLHGVTLPSVFTSEAERTKLLNEVMDLRDDDKLSGAQAKELRVKIMGVKVEASTENGITKKYIETWEDLYGSFDMVTGRSKGGTADLLKDWNKSGSYDCADALFQVATGIMKLLCYTSKNVDSTVFNSIIKRAVNNIKSQLVSFQTNGGNANTTINGDRCTLEESQYALTMILHRIDVLIDILYKVLELIDGRCESLGGEINLENIRKAMKAEAERQAKAEAPTEQPQADATEQVAA